MNAVAAALAPTGASFIRKPDLLPWNAILDAIASDKFHGAKFPEVVRPYLFDLLNADAEFDYEVTTSKEYRDAVNLEASGVDVDWNQIMRPLHLRIAAKIVREGLESR